MVPQVTFKSTVFFLKDKFHLKHFKSHFVLTSVRLRLKNLLFGQPSSMQILNKYVFNAFN